MNTGIPKALSFLLLLLASTSLRAADEPIRTLRASTNHSTAVVRVRADKPSGHAIPVYLTSKFAEHLGANIYKGMEAQVLANPTFAAYPIWNGSMTPDGLTRFMVDGDAINQNIRRQAKNFGWPEGEIDEMVTAQVQAMACFWTRVGDREAVQCSPDTGPFGGRAQRIQLKTAGKGIAQWTYLPLHRTRRYEFEIFLRSPNIKIFTVALAAEGTDKLGASKTITNDVSADWQKFSGSLELPDSTPADASCKLSLIADAAGQFVVQRVLLRPADHFNGADPDIVRLLKESHLPLLRWPGGNFVSSYHWQDGVGRLEQRPTLPNYAWGGLEPNTFGTDEFMSFCKAVGCEPMICINAGTGTPEEAARWIEYCNGPTNSPMGHLRLANGHPEPYRVKHWEVGNELWGSWQANWTTPAGYPDRYLRFARAMRAADPTVTLYACGAPVLWGKEWNDSLISTVGPKMQITTDHPLIGGNLQASTDPLDVYRDFMAVPEVLEKRWQNLEEQMQKGGITSPRLAITELQLFAHLENAAGASPASLNGSNLVNPGTQAEAVYDILIYHALMRLAPFVEVMTHSAVVNHGGGLRKQRERVYANPCHYAQSAFAALAGASVVAVEIECASEKAPRVLPDLRNAVTNALFSDIDAIAAVSNDKKSLWISLVNRGTSGAVDVCVEAAGFEMASSSELRMLSADLPWESNTLKEPERIKPVDSTITVRDGKLVVHMPPYAVARVRIPKL